MFPEGGAFSQTPTEGMIRELREKTDRIKQMQAEVGFCGFYFYFCRMRCVNSQ